MRKVHSLGCSGGRTSAFMSRLFQLGETGLHDGLPHENLFCDTGGEDPGTYQFLRDMVSQFGINITCIEADIINGRGTNDFKVKLLKDCKFDLSVMKKCIVKYGGFTKNRPWCTDKFKTLISTKFRNTLHGHNNYYIWIGIRYDEPARLVGDHTNPNKSVYKQLRKLGWDNDEISDLFLSIYLQTGLSGLKFLDGLKIPDLTKKLLSERITSQKKLGLRYLAEISDFTKEDILEWWSKQSFDLTIPEHLGNCIFCIKKSELKIALAQRDRPEHFEEWENVMTGDHVRLMPADKFGTGHIYRGWETPQQLIARFKDVPTYDLRERIYKTKAFDTGSCSESCEAFGDLGGQPLSKMNKLDSEDEQEQMI